MQPQPHDIEYARRQMVEQQVRAWEVLDPRVLDTLATVPREDFVPAAYRGIAFADTQIPLGHGEVMMAPKVEGRLLQALAIRPEDRILEIGTGSGFLTACLARLGREVVSVDIHGDFVAAAGDKLRAHGITNVSLETRDASRPDWAAERFDVIAVTGSLPVLDEGWRRRLTVGGRLFVVVGEPPVMEALLVTRVSEDAWSQESLFETVIPPLRNVPRPVRFVL
ncbi:MAG TPA: protein-L-isoaspartate O-methyltransferase [Gammaproteobacteria bacterium]|nr:protein-L-isoaspartate O-methyltransferase [Gammaproteobacteria bacterium]